ncbi:MAG: MBL fold metallo-hydrolase [Deltaproteobacteria bacterium]|nr:MBL fold metallo-hydrolase [Deltaproteobacteria bacterium]
MKLTFAGHSTVICETPLSVVISDPLITNRVMGLKLKVPVCIPSDIPERVSVVLISHAHNDHLHIPSLKKINSEALVITPPECSKYIRKAGLRNVVELNWYESHSSGDVEITSVPVNHVKGRYFSCGKSGVAGYIISSGGKNVMLSGDIDVGPVKYIEEISQKFSLDVIFLPIGGMKSVEWYEKRNNKKGVHIAPGQAYEIFKKSGSKILVPLHWGSLSVSSENFDAAPKRLLEIAADERVKILYQGEVMELEH